ncbi:MAG: hydrogenase, partial [Gemmatimonadales bacterium]
MRGRPSDAALTDHLLSPLWRSSRAWWVLFSISALATLLLLATVTYTVARGIGTWGNNIPVAWAFAITNFVWWIGIGHAGTFISAFLLLLNQRWRGSINRVAEAMTIFALVNAAIFPLLHLGRPWFFYWLVPYPATTGMWPNFKSSLPWDVAAITTYFTVSLL